MLTYTVNSVSEAIFILNQFSSVSGLRLNIAKCSGMWLGLLRNNLKNVEGITFTIDPVICLGVFIGTDKETCKSFNWDKQISKIEDLLLRWSMRKMVKFKLSIPWLCQIWYIFSLVFNVIKTLDRIISKFAWGNVQKIKKIFFD